MTTPKSDPDRALFADELRAMRKQRELSRDELGAMINFSGSTDREHRAWAARPDS